MAGEDQADQLAPEVLAVVRTAGMVIAEMLSPMPLPMRAAVLGWLLDVLLPDEGVAEQVRA